MIAKIQQYLLFYEWPDYSQIGVNDGYNSLLSVITEALDLYAPKKKIVLTADNKFNEPWLLVKLLKYNRKSRQLCNRAHKTGDVADFRKYRNYRNILNRLKVYEKKCYYSDFFNKIGRNSKLMWDVINNIITKNQ